jgi:ATP-dependent DNA helicase DinG
LLSPAELGAPSKFAQWRHGQDDAFLFALQSEKRYTLLAEPTGVGKTAIGITLQKALDQRAVYLTADLGLQDQLLADMSGDRGYADQRGMGNYPCLDDPITMPAPRCSEGVCLDGIQCVLRDGGCTYYDAIRHAAGRPLVSANYSWWLHAKGKSPSIMPRTLLICDEAHDAADAIARHLRIEFNKGELRGAWKLPKGWEKWKANEWVAWSLDVTEHVARARDEALSSSTKRALRKTTDKIKSVAERIDSGWLVTPGEDGDLALEPIWPQHHAEEYLFRNIPRVILMSATMRPQQLGYLGIQESEFDCHEGMSPLPASNRPIYLVPIGRLSQRTDSATWDSWVQYIDAIVGARADRKGIIHTVSYDRMQLLQALSRHSSRFIVHDRGQARDAVRRFRDAGPGAVLVSPSVGTGFDFPFDAATYQVIAKAPWEVPSPLMQARELQDAAYSIQRAIARLVQACGRVMRDPDDVGETFIMDAHVGWWRERYYALFPLWWHEAFRRVGKERAIGRLPLPPALPWKKGMEIAA